MRGRGWFGSGSLAAAGATVLLAQSFHSIMLLPLQAGQTGGWLCVLLAGLWASLACWPVLAVLARTPGGNLLSLARTAAGTPGAIATSLLICSLAVYHAGLLLRQTAEMAVSSAYPLTPQTFAIACLLLCSLLGASARLPALVRLYRLFLPVLVASILFIVGGVLGWMELRNLLPLWGPGPGPLLLRSLGATGLFSPGLFVLLATGPVRSRQRLWLAALAPGGVGLIYALVTAALIMIYGYPFGNAVPFLLHEMARLILGGRFFQRVEGLWVLIWVFATTCHLSALLHVAAAAFADALNMSSYRAAVLSLATLTLTVALFPPDQARTVAWQLAEVPAAAGIGFGLPLALTLAAAWRRRGAHAG